MSYSVILEDTSVLDDETNLLKVKMVKPNVIESIDEFDNLAVSSNGVIIVDTDTDTDTNEPSVTCLSQVWQNSSVEIEKWTFEDLDDTIDQVRNLIIKGSHNELSIPQLKSKSHTTNSLIYLLKERTKELLKIMS
ncbi:hypothetical protein DAMA08_038300 [Martiniozyma asiatica (nom. inval.)]|nr:hypothetical protein DAMA08_038300 [Martiniozyma asiatica]